MQISHHSNAIETGLSTLKFALHWLLSRLVGYILVAVFSAILFLLGAAFYSYIWPAPPTVDAIQGRVVPPEPIQERKPPGLLAPDKPAQSAEAIVSVAPPKGLGASNIIGKYIFGPDDKSIGWVEDITISDKGEVS